MKFTNPILPGFNPDPSIIRVGEDYYIATSTFEWFPGVQIHHSRDLVNWELITHPLSTVNLLDIKGVPDSCGVWAPCLTYSNETFYLVYSAVRSFDGMYKDTPNFLTTAKDIKGPWSDPIFLDASGFDGSLFHDHDGRKFYLSMLVDHRNGKFFGGIIMQEYSEGQEKLVGDKKLIFEGTELGVTEAPHLYQYGNYYYLVTAEGGTEYGHAVSVARSNSMWGPYETMPDNPLVSARYNLDYPIQKTGHGDIFWMDDDRSFIVFLGGRPLSSEGRCPLGRETFIEELVWENQWPKLKNRGRLTRENIPDFPSRHTDLSEVLDFSEDELSIHYQSLRIPIESSWCRRIKKSGVIQLLGRESLASTFEQSLLARRVQHFNFEYVIQLDFKPRSFQQMAGLVCYYNTGHYYYLNIAGSNLDGERLLHLIKCDNFDYTDVLSTPIMLPENGKVELQVRWNHDNIQFAYRIMHDDWVLVGLPQDASILSDDYVRDGSDRYRPAFTGSFVGFCCQDLTGQKINADFYNCKYLPLDS